MTFVIGDAPRRRHVRSLPQDIRDLEPVRQHFGVQKVNLIGYSLCRNNGGVVYSQTAGNHLPSAGRTTRGLTSRV
jgi:hypothetical protein